MPDVYNKLDSLKNLVQKWLNSIHKSELERRARLIPGLLNNLEIFQGKLENLSSLDDLQEFLDEMQRHELLQKYFDMPGCVVFEKQLEFCINICEHEQTKQKHQGHQEHQESQKQSGSKLRAERTKIHSLRLKLLEAISSHKHVKSKENISLLEAELEQKDQLLEEKQRKVEELQQQLLEQKSEKAEAGPEDCSSRLELLKQDILKKAALGPEEGGFKLGIGSSKFEIPLIDGVLAKVPERVFKLFNCIESRDHRNLEEKLQEVEKILATVKGDHQSGVLFWGRTQPDTNKFLQSLKGKMDSASPSM
ncbi:hypothetical protein [Piscirickettsia salmonis]|uniref:hypothetical protein n=1 Tax=Piscirickettsia salmonis TaxID=1238 RepID=UPI000318EB5D|nr:hypothetical protein [Piscirickettsia salmonis]APS58285.1 hypothetical protein AVI52_14225 [Piscirickettsia salmonis]PEQ16152.1 hypothetical protein X973_09105 [Piscirickettsia salmonis]QGN76607.1 hypothetical protein Psal001_00791 [Piscirickettsia salmonis]QGN80197.1 hypothetical protein Psal002_00816 [Piscirickettsia salmonis]QGN85531.1 hypothetical protein Psal003_02616 [Piscirickettsia salmonis]